MNITGGIYRVYYDVFVVIVEVTPVASWMCS